MAVRSEMLTSTARRCSVRIVRGRPVVGPDVLEDRRVPGLFGVMVDDEVDAIDETAEVVRLDVDHRDAVVFLERFGGDRLDVDVEQVDHPLVFRAGHALDRADDRGRLGAAQDVAQRQAAGHRIGVRIVVQHDQDPIGVAQIALVLLHAGAGQRPAELGQQRHAEQFRHRQIGDVGKLAVELFLPPGAGGGTGVEGVDQRAARVADRLESLFQAAAGVVFDDDAGAGADVGLQVGVGAARIANRRLNAGVVQTPRHRLALDDELDVEAGPQALIEEPDDQFVLTDGDTSHTTNRRLYAAPARPVIEWNPMARAPRRSATVEPPKSAIAPCRSGRPPCWRRRW